MHTSMYVGSESGIVLLSTVRSKPKDEISIQDGSSERKNADIGWVRRNLGFVTDRHQICVGLTRCKYGLVIVGKGMQHYLLYLLVLIILCTTLSFGVGNKHLLSYDGTWRKLIEHYEKNGCVKDGNNFSYLH